MPYILRTADANGIRKEVGVRNCYGARFYFAKTVYKRVYSV